MICLVALFVFAVLGLFSAKYRSLAKEAFNCVFLRMTLRPCDTGFDRKMKMKLVGKLMTKNRKIAGFVFRHFEVLSWVFTLLFFASLLTFAKGTYNFAVYGSCEPHSDFCIFNLNNSGPSCGSSYCEEFGCNCGDFENNCTLENNFAACDGNCECNTEVCG
jgi:hypothetical protein